MAKIIYMVFSGMIFGFWVCYRTLLQPNNFGIGNSPVFLKNDVFFSNRDNLKYRLFCRTKLYESHYYGVDKNNQMTFESFSLKNTKKEKLFMFSEE